MPDVIAAGVDWTLLIELASRHRILPLVFHSVQHSWSQVAPPQVISRLRAAVAESTRNNLTCTRELYQILTLLHVHRLDVILLKGPTLASLLYGNLAMRSFSDLDLLVKPSDVIRVVDLLIANGFRLLSNIHWPAKSAWFQSKEGQLSFASPADVSVDLHWQLLPQYFAMAPDFERLWERRQSILLGGQTGESLSDEDLLLFLCAHGAKHLWGRLGWICDVAQLLNVRLDLDWTYLLAEAARTRMTNMLYVGLRLASELLGTRTSDVQLLDRQRAQLVTQAVQRIKTRIFETRGVPKVSECLRLNLPLIETLAQRRRYISGLLLSPTEAEFEKVKLPPWLFNLYYPYRAARLVAKYVFHRSVFRVC